MKKLKKIFNILFPEKEEIVELSMPYIVECINETEEDLTVVLFGFNDNLFLDNFGNPTGIKLITPLGGSYSRLLLQSSNKQFKVGKFRFRSTTKKQLEQLIVFKKFDSNGCYYSHPISLADSKDVYQFQNDVLDLTKEIFINAETQISFNLLAKSSLHISMYPISIENRASSLMRKFYTPTRNISGLRLNVDSWFEIKINKIKVFFANIKGSIKNKFKKNA